MWFFKKKNKVNKERFNLNAFSDLRKEVSSPSEPLTLAKIRLEGGANDVGSQRGLKTYNSHKTKISNQWINPLQSINTGFGSSQYAYYNYQSVNYFECYSLAQDPLFNKIFNVLSKTPFANGGKVSAELSEEEEKALDKGCIKFRLIHNFISAVRSSYVCGGCFLYLDFGLSNLEEPLDLNHIDMRKFKGFRHIDPINVVAVEVNTVEPAKENYMEPDMWYIIGLGNVHKSHLLKFEENAPELIMKPMTMYFGMPLTLLIKQDVANSSLASQGLANLMNRFRNLYLQTSTDNFTGDGAVDFRNRLEAMSMVQDNFSIYPIKDTENIQQFVASVSGMSQDAEFFYQIISSKTDITLSILLGKGAQGLSGTLEGERKNFYDRIRAEQEEVKPNLLKALGIIFGYMTDGKFKVFDDYIFNSLEQSDEREKAENLRSYSEVASKLIEMGVSSEDALGWLRNFKDFHLENIEITADTSDLDDYDNIGSESDLEEKTDKE